MVTLIAPSIERCFMGFMKKVLFALVAGHPELITASVSVGGIQFGGIIGASAPIVFGRWETLRNEFK